MNATTSTNFPPPLEVAFSAGAAAGIRAIRGGSQPQLERPMNATKEQVKTTLDTVRAVADAIRELGSVPSGTFYAVVMAHMDLPTYQRIVTLLKDAGLVEEENHLLTWTGPKLETKTTEAK
jgi:hypothetical protein